MSDTAILFVAYHIMHRWYTGAGGQENRFGGVSASHRKMTQLLCSF